MLGKHRKPHLSAFHRVTVQKSGIVPHTALIYANQQDRNRLIESCLERTNTSWKSVKVLSAQPEADTRVFRGMIRRKGWARGRCLLSVVDIREPLSEGRNAVGNIISHTRGASASAREESPPLVIGDWTHLVYDTFQTALSIEEAEEGMLNLICCYRGEGFWSLDCKQVTQILERHQRVMFGPAVLEMTVRPDAGLPVSMNS